ncbi:MAG TPA: ABC transporter permease subunit, partial [Candidatus Limnocylindrales bacterium]
MMGYRLMLAKELREQLRTYRLPVVAIVFLLFGILSPVSAKYLPDIVKALAGDQGAALLSALPTPTVDDAVGQIIKNVTQFGILVAVLLAMGTVANEKERGTAGLLLSKPISRAAFLAAKLSAVAFTLGVAVVVGSAIGFVYTALLFDAPLSITGFAAMAVLLWLSLVAYAALTFLGSTLTRSAMAAAGLGIVAFVATATIAFLPVIGPYMPQSLGTPALAYAVGDDPGFV